MPFCPECKREYLESVKTCAFCNIPLVEMLPQIDTPIPELTDPIVCVATFRYPTEANLSKALLESEGIDSIVWGEHFGAVNILYSEAGGGVRLMVKQSDAFTAREILENVRKNHIKPDQYDGEYCPNCGSWDVKHLKVATKPFYIVWLLSFLWSSASAFFIALPFVNTKWECNACKHHWNKAKDKPAEKQIIN